MGIPKEACYKCAHMVPTTSPYGEKNGSWVCDIDGYYIIKLSNRCGEYVPVDETAKKERVWAVD